MECVAWLENNVGVRLSAETDLGVHECAKQCLSAKQRYLKARLVLLVLCIKSLRLLCIDFIDFHIIHRSCARMHTCVLRRLLLGIFGFRRNELLRLQTHSTTLVSRSERYQIPSASGFRLHYRNGLSNPKALLPQSVQCDANIQLRCLQNQIPQRASRYQGPTPVIPDPYKTISVRLRCDTLPSFFTFPANERSYAVLHQTCLAAPLCPFVSSQHKNPI